MDLKRIWHTRDDGLRRRRSPAIAALAALLAVGCGGSDPSAPAPSAREAGAPALVAQVLPAFLAARGRTWPASSPAVVQAKAQLSQGNLRGARAILRQQRTSDPADLEALFLLSSLHYQEARFGLALEGLEQVLRSGPSFSGNEQVFYLYGLCQARLGDAAEARAAFLALLEFSPGNGEILQLLGELDLQENKVEQALLHLEQAIESFRAAQARGTAIGDALARAYARSGEARLQAGELELARQNLEQALALNPEDAAAHYALSRVLSRLGDKPGAAREMQEFQKRQSGDGLNRPLSEEGQ